MFISFIESNMCKVHEFFIVLCLLFARINSAKISSCISNTPCKCFLTEHSFTLINCSNSLPDLPIFNSNTSLNITKIIARNALSHWPSHLCKYSNIQILDLSNSYFDSQLIDLSCLSQLIHLNLINTQLRKLPNFENHFIKHLQILDLSSNQIEFLDGKSFRSLNKLITLYIQNNPLKQIVHFEYLLGLSSLEFINLISSNSIMPIQKPLTANQWVNLAHKWNNSDKAFVLRTNTIPFQSIFPNPDQFHLISLDSMKIIFNILLNSTFTTLFSTPKCNCTHLRNYQRVFSFINFDQNLSPLFQSVTCLMPNGIIHARLFDRWTFTDLHCSVIGKTIHTSTIQNACSLLNCHLFIQFFIFYLFC
jgi:hypothetical protein